MIYRRSSGHYCLLYTIILQILNIFFSTTQSAENEGLIQTLIRLPSKLPLLPYFGLFLTCSANFASFTTHSYFTIMLFINSLYIQNRKILTPLGNNWIQLVYQAICIYYLYPYEIVASGLADCFLLNFWIVLVCIYIIAIFQKNYGTLCFLPNSWRHLKHDYEFKIAQDFRLTHLDENECPECNFCMEKLYLFSPLCYDEKVDRNSKRVKHDIYMKAPDSRLYHEQCLEYMIKNQIYYDSAYPNVNEFED